MSTLVQLEWRDLGDGWQYASTRLPGYDCRVECKHTPRGDHGVGCDKWVYVVRGDECALSLYVSSGVYPKTASHLDGPPRGSDLSLHVPWPMSEEAIRTGDAGCECNYLPSGRCWIPYSTALGAHEFWEAHGRPSFEQPKEFWAAMREKCKEWICKAKEDRKGLDGLRCCPACNGRGVVPVAPPEEPKDG